MSSNWMGNLDMLAQEGVINFDAPAFVMGTKPRYVGNPRLSQMQPFPGPIPEAPLINQPQPLVDEFQKQDNNNHVKNPTWKKVLFGLVAAGTLIFAGYKFKKTLIPYAKKACTNISDFCKNSWNKFTGLFKKKKTP